MRKELESLKQMRHKINQTEEMAKLDEQRAKENLKHMKQSDYDQFIENKNQSSKNAKQADQDYIGRQLAIEDSRMQAERQRRESDRDMLKAALIDQILSKNQKATAASLRFPEVSRIYVETGQRI